MSDILTPDICVVGAGAAGLSVAAAAAAFGVSVILVEKDRLGGDCLYTGCVPSKALIAAAAQRHAAGRAKRLGIGSGDAEADFAAVMDHVRGVIAAIAPNDSAERFAALGVKVLRGEARFKDRRTLTAGSREIRARRIVLATGSRPLVPPIPNLESVPFLTNESVFDLKRLPAHLVVIGAGPVGLELAQAFRRLGSDVTVLEAGKALVAADPEIAAQLMETLRGEGIRIHEGATVTRVVKRGRLGVRLSLEGLEMQQLDGSHLLIAAGRRPELDMLGLQEAGIAFDAAGIAVDRRLRTTNRRVYAIGDAAAGPNFTHWANYQAGLVVRSILFRFGGRVQPELLPWVIFTDPEFGHVGLNEEEARRRHGAIRILRWPFCENDRAQAERSTRGFLKIVTTKKGRVVGASILGENAGELIAPLALAVSQRLGVKALATAVLPYPTRSEAARRAAITFYAPMASSPWVKRAIRLLRRLG